MVGKVEPQITGYRSLTTQEVDAINRLKDAEAAALKAIDDLRATGIQVDPRWIDIGYTDIQTGFMALVRAVARPTR